MMSSRASSQLARMCVCVYMISAAIRLTNQSYMNHAEPQYVTYKEEKIQIQRRRRRRRKLRLSRCFFSLLVVRIVRCHEVAKECPRGLHGCTPEEDACLALPLSVHEGHLARLFVRRASNNKYNNFLRPREPSSPGRTKCTTTPREEQRVRGK